MTEGDYERFQNLEQEIKDALGEAVLAKKDPAGEAGRRVVLLHKEWLSMTWKEYSENAHRGVANLYVMDERFQAYYDKEVEGCAALGQGNKIKDLGLENRPSPFLLLKKPGEYIILLFEVKRNGKNKRQTDRRHLLYPCGRHVLGALWLLWAIFISGKGHHGGMAGNGASGFCRRAADFAGADFDEKENGGCLERICG